MGWLNFQRIFETGIVGYFNKYTHEELVVYVEEDLDIIELQNSFDFELEDR